MPVKGGNLERLKHAEIGPVKKKRGFFASNGRIIDKRAMPGRGNLNRPLRKIRCVISDAVLVAICAAVPPTVVAFAGLIQSLRNSKKLDQGHEKLEEVRKLTNGMNDKIAESAKATGFAEGVAQEKSDREAREK